MKTNTLHVVSCSSYCHLVKMGLKEMQKDEKVIYLPVNFSTGHILKDFSDKELCLALASYGNFEDFDRLKNFLTYAYSSYDKVIVWHGWSGEELLLLYLMSVLVSNNLYHIDIRDCESFMKKNKTPYPSMGYVSLGDIYSNKMDSYAKLITDEERLYNIKQWNMWAHSKNSNNVYRLSNSHTGIIHEYPIGFMDDYILKCVEHDSNWRRVVAQVMYKYDNFFIPDGIIIRRIWELCKTKLRADISLTINT